MTVKKTACVERLKCLLLESTKTNQQNLELFILPVKDTWDPEEHPVELTGHPCQAGILLAAAVQNKLSKTV